MIDIKLDGVSPDGEKHVAYLKIIDPDSGKILGQKCVPYTTEAEFGDTVDKLLTEYQQKQEPIEAIKVKILNKLSAINLAKKEVKS